MKLQMEDKLMRQLLNEYFEEIFLQSGKNIKIFDLLFFLYAYLVGNTPKELYNKLNERLSMVKSTAIWSSENEFKEIVSLNKYSRINKKINNIIKALIYKYDLWIVL